MSIQNSLIPTGRPHDPPETVLLIRFLEDESLQVVRSRPVVARAPTGNADLVPATRTEPPLASNEARSDHVFLRIVRANLHAAALHAELGHEARTFRECSYSACRDAVKLVPSLSVEPGMTDAHLDAIFQRALG
jgi:hypothetical protein